MQDCSIYVRAHGCVQPKRLSESPFVERMPTSVGRVAIYIGLPISAALLILAFCSFVRRGRRTGDGEVRHSSTVAAHATILRM